MSLLTRLNPKRSLFARIFLSFWGMLLMMLIMLILVLFLSDSDYVEGKREKNLDQIKAIKESLITFLEQEDEASAILLLENTKPHLRDQFRVYDEDGFELLDRYYESESSIFRPIMSEQPPIFREKVGDEFGVQYDVFVRLRPRLNLLMSRHPSSVAFRTVVALLVSLFGCYWLARSLTQPIKQLQSRARYITEQAMKEESKLELPNIQYGQDELGKLGRDIDKMTQQLQQNITQKQQLLQDVAHELRAPLSRQSVALAMLSDKPEKFSKLKQQLENDHAQLTHLVEQTLSWFRQNNHDLVSKQINLTEVCREIVADASFEFPSITVELTTNKDFIINADATLIRHAIENIVRNAGRFANSQVTLTLNSDDSHIYLTIHDDGIGVPEADLSRIFEPFAQVDSARTPDIKKGAGLGLAIAKQAVLAHHGTLHAENNKGLIVTITLPKSNNHDAHH